MNTPLKRNQIIHSDNFEMNLDKSLLPVLSEIHWSPCGEKRDNSDDGPLIYAPWLASYLATISYSFHAPKNRALPSSSIIRVESLSLKLLTGTGESVVLASVLAAAGPCDWPSRPAAAMTDSRRLIRFSISVSVILLSKVIRTSRQEVFLHRLTSSPASSSSLRKLSRMCYHVQYNAHNFHLSSHT